MRGCRGATHGNRLRGLLVVPHLDGGEIEQNVPFVRGREADDAVALLNLGKPDQDDVARHFVGLRAPEQLQAEMLAVVNAFPVKVLVGVVFFQKFLQQGPLRWMRGGVAQIGGHGRQGPSMPS